MFNSISNTVKAHPVAFVVAVTATQVVVTVAASKFSEKFINRFLGLEYERQSSNSDKN